MTSAYLDRVPRSLAEVANEMRAVRNLYRIWGKSEIAETLQGMIDTLEDEMEIRSAKC